MQSGRDDSDDLEGRPWKRILQQEDLNFLLTNRIPRRLAHPVHGLVQPDQNPLVRGPLDLGVSLLRRRSGSATRPEKPHSTAFTTASSASSRTGARPIDHRPDVLVSPCDAHRGRLGPVNGTELIQAKGFPYTPHRPAPRPRAGRLLHEWPLRDLAAEVEHVPPLSCAPRLPGRTRDLHFRATPGTSTRSRSGGSSGSILQE